MKVSRHGFRSIFSSSGAPLNGPICNSCRNTLRRASTAAAVAPSPSSDTSSAYEHEHANPKPSYQLRTGVVLSRPPQITRDLTPFEKSFYLYQRRLNERLALPAMQYFYFRPDTPAMIDWQRKRKMRKGVAARDIGMYNPYAEDGWNDELLVGAPESEPEHQAGALLKDSVPLSKENDEVQTPVMQELVPRVTEADKSNDQRSLNRLLQRTLYLLVQSKQGRWTFPEGVLAGRESLGLAADRILTQAGGVNMNTWIVGNHPVGHHVKQYRQPQTDETANTFTLGEKIFFMKARIMAGQADLKENELGLQNFKWLAREEVEEQVDPFYWKGIRNMLPAR